MCGDADGRGKNTSNAETQNFTFGKMLTVEKFPAEH